MKKKLKQIIDFLFSTYEIKNSTNNTNLINREILIGNLKTEILKKCPESLIACGYSIYSQNEEDGIINEVFSKLGIKQINFLEFGVHPTENNSLNILLNGGKGCWFDKSLTGFKQELGPRKALKMFDEFITLKNFDTLVRNGLDFLQINEQELDFLSLDLDGNDYYFIEQLQKVRIMPKMYCLEYNAKFRPPMDIKTKFSESHTWELDDYFGCSLQAYVNLLKKDYDLLVCNITGSNAFFIRKDFSNLFTIYPLENVYQPPRYFLSGNPGHKSSSKFAYLIE